VLYCLAPAVGLALLYLVVTSALFPAINPLKSTRSFAGVIKKITAQHRADGGEVLAFEIGNLPKGISFYSNGIYLREVASLPELTALLGDERSRYAVVQRQHLDEFPEELRRAVEVRASTRLSRKDAVLISIEPIP
jgi:hypothetical protein